MSCELCSTVEEEFGEFIKHSVPAVRLVAHHVVHWLVPDAQKKKSAGRFGGKVDWQHTLATGYFTKRHYSQPEAAAAGLICLLTQITYDHIHVFSPKKRLGLDSYPTVKTVKSFKLLVLGKKAILGILYYFDKNRQSDFEERE